MNSRGASQLIPFCSFCFVRELVYNITVDALLKTGGHLAGDSS